ncbi:MAG: hypothetical protein HZA54_09395 [Planctomycetes bacterium]|nr:hypothetical protein [Planctomycetota bacterium]
MSRIPRRSGALAFALAALCGCARPGPLRDPGLPRTLDFTVPHYAAFEPLVAPEVPFRFEAHGTRGSREVFLRLYGQFLSFPEARIDGGTLEPRAGMAELGATARPDRRWLWGAGGWAREAEIGWVPPPPRAAGRDLTLLLDLRVAAGPPPGEARWGVCVEIGQTPQGELRYRRLCVTRPHPESRQGLHDECTVPSAAAAPAPAAARTDRRR